MMFRKSVLCGALVLGGAVLGAAAAAAESRGYVISNFHTATYANPDNCPGGGNGTAAEIKVRNMIRMGYSRDDALKIVANNDRTEKGERVDVLRRGRVDGKPADISNFPWSAPDPNIELVQGKYAFGFDLDGKEGPASFVDPDTLQKGIDNQLWRAMGCFEVYNVRRPVKPYLEDITWDTQMDAMPAWIMSVSGEDLSRDGDVTITFNRAVNHVLRAAHGGTNAGMSFIIDPNPRSRSTFKGRIENGYLVIAEPASFTMLSEAPFHPIIQFHHTHLRLRMHENGNLSGHIGGYEPWMNYYTFLAIRGEGTGQIDLPGSYYALKRLADGIPDPKTGENTAISVAYYMEAVPAFHTDIKGNVVAEAFSGLTPPPDQLASTGAR